MTELLHSGRTDLETIVFERRSIRGYKNQPVLREVLEEVLRIAQRAPSSMNTQPWHFHVFTGEPLERIREGNTEKMVSGSTVDREITLNHGYEGAHRERHWRTTPSPTSIAVPPRTDWCWRHGRKAWTR